MLDSTAPIPLEYQLPAEAYYHLVRTMRLAMPPPLTDTAEDLVRRDKAIMARIAGLYPANAAEADIAAQYVTAAEHWNHCLRLAGQPGATPEQAAKCRADAATMIRESKGALRLLLQMQGARRKLEADNVACNRANWAEHVATRLMAEALSALSTTPADVAGPPSPQATPAHPTSPAPPAASGHVAKTPPAAPVPSPDPGVAEPPAGDPQNSAELVAIPATPPAWAATPSPGWAEDFEPDLVAAAEHYAVIYPERAALIRRLRRLPDDVSFGPPDDDLVQALITANTPALAELDRASPKTRAA